MDDKRERFELEAPKPGVDYLCFSLDVDEDEAAQRFKARYGHWPEQILEDKGMLWLGPVKEK